MEMGDILSGKIAKLNIPGTATAVVGEATTGTGNVSYQITDTAKQVLEPDSDVSVHKYSADDTAEASPDTTNIYMTGHGLVTGDLIINTTRSNAKRIVTRVDDDHVTVSAVTDQAIGDTIEKCPTESSSSYSLNRLI